METAFTVEGCHESGRFHPAWGKRRKRRGLADRQFSLDEEILAPNEVYRQQPALFTPSRTLHLSIDPASVRLRLQRKAFSVA